MGASALMKPRPPLKACLCRLRKSHARPQIWLSRHPQGPVSPLLEGYGEPELIQAATSLAATIPVFTIDAFKLASIGRFIASGTRW